MSKDKWLWQGYPGHFIGAAKCLFRLNTVVKEKFIISTVGDYRETPTSTEGSLGYDRTFETMVFTAQKCTCGCGGWIPSCFREIDSAGYDNPDEATRGHYAMCEMYDNEEEDTTKGEQV